MIEVGNSRVRIRPFVATRNVDEGLRATGIIGRAPTMLRVFEQLHCVAKSDLSVLLVGETGTGKELIARELHRLRQDQGRAGPFVVVDCTNVPTTLAESLFLGHKKGAFTGAIEDRRSPFEDARGGTVFLDEIGELPYALQSKLLRIVQEREVRAIGSNVVTPIDVRLITATHRNLAEMVESGQFREDLYYRLCESVIELPPLRERGDDILALAQSFLREVDPGKRFDATAELALLRARWPGNARQLRAVVRHAAAMTPDRRELTANDLFDAAPPTPSRGRGLRAKIGVLLDEPWEIARDTFARLYWEHAHRRFAGSTSSIASHTQVSTVAVRARKKQFALE